MTNEMKCDFGGVIKEPEKGESSMAERNDNVDVQLDCGVGKQLQYAEDVTDEQSYQLLQDKAEKLGDEISDELIKGTEPPTPESQKVSDLAEDFSPENNYSDSKPTSAFPNSTVEMDSVSTQVPISVDNESETTISKTQLNKSGTDSRPSLYFKINIANESHKEVLASLDAFIKTLSEVSLSTGNVGQQYNAQINYSNTEFYRRHAVNVKIDHAGWNNLDLNVSHNASTGIIEIEGVPSSEYDGDVRIIVELDVERLLYLEKGAFTGTCSFRLSCSKSLIINPDSWTLWNDLQTPEKGEYLKNDTDKASATLCKSPQMTFLCASQRGRSHAHEGKFREDHFFCDLAESVDQWSLITVADGAGSAQFSREGSKIACTKMVESLRADFFNKYPEKIDDAIRALLLENMACNSEVEKTFEASDFVVGSDPTGTKYTVDYFIASSVRKVYDAIANTAKEYNKKIDANATFESPDAFSSAMKQAKAEIRDYNTTLLFAAIKRFPATETTKDFWAIITYWVGDGGLAIYLPNGRNDVITMGTPDCGEFAGQTRFITMSEEIELASVTKRVRIVLVENFKALVLMTDGLTDPFFPAEKNLGEIDSWRKFWNETLQGKDKRVHRFEPNDSQDFIGVLDKTRSVKDRAQSLLNGLKFKVKGNHDDRTIALLINDDILDEVSVESNDVMNTNEGVVNSTPTDSSNVEAKDRYPDNATETSFDPYCAATSESSPPSPEILKEELEEKSDEPDPEEKAQ